MAKVRMEKLQAARMGNHALEMVSDLIERFGSRLTGTPGCTKTAEVLASELSKYCDRVEKEAFSLHPKAFLGWIRILVTLYPPEFVRPKKLKIEENDMQDPSRVNFFAVLSIFERI